MPKALRAALLRFYDEHARDLPWRRTRDPYAIWVSEIMLQQTRVDTVRRYYDRFLERFPTTTALARASEDQVLSAWSGLGYYRRARLLHAGVREVVASYGGQVPADAQARRKLPGIGRYTAGAIGSIAFDRPEPIVDGNVARVLCRVHAIESPLGRADTEALLWQHAGELAKGPRPGALNQALMELGATLCSKRSPRCEQCPLQRSCLAHAQGRAQELPVPRKKTPPKAVQWVAVAVLDDTRQSVVLSRGQSALFGGLWNLPMREGSDADAAKQLLTELGVAARLSRQPLGRLEHLLTHRRLQVTLFGAKLSQLPTLPTLRLLPASGLADARTQVGVSTLTRKALAQVFRT